MPGGTAMPVLVLCACVLLRLSTMSGAVHRANRITPRNIGNPAVSLPSVTARPGRTPRPARGGSPRALSGLNLLARSALVERTAQRPLDAESGHRAHPCPPVMSLPPPGGIAQARGQWLRVLSHDKKSYPPIRRQALDGWPSKPCTVFCLSGPAFLGDTPWSACPAESSLHWPGIAGAEPPPRGPAAAESDEPSLNSRHSPPQPIGIRLLVS